MWKLFLYDSNRTEVYLSIRNSLQISFSFSLIEKEPWNNSSHGIAETNYSRIIQYLRSCPVEELIKRMFVSFWVHSWKYEYCFFFKTDLLAETWGMLSVIKKQNEQKVSALSNHMLFFWFINPPQETTDQKTSTTLQRIWGESVKMCLWMFIFPHYCHVAVNELNRFLWIS